MTLTVVIPTVRERAQLLSRCLWYLEHQSRSDFEAIVVHSGSGKGEKLNRAFPRVTTSHVLVVDDDDWLSPNHMEAVLPHTEDWVGYELVEMVAGRFHRIVGQEPGSHVCPVRSDLARQVPFGDDYVAAYEWTARIAELVDTTSYIPQPLYFYDKWNKPGSGWSPARSVGWWPHTKPKWMWL